MGLLPVTVTEVKRLKSATWGVSVTFADGSTGNYVVPESVATYDGVRLSALVIAQLYQQSTIWAASRPRRHRRYDPTA